LIHDDLGDRLRARALSLGADFFGIADLAPAHGFVVEQGGEMLAGFPRAISVGVAMPSAIVDQLAHQENRLALIAYRSHSYDVLNVRLDQLASRLASDLQQEGQMCVYVCPHGQRWEDWATARGDLRSRQTSGKLGSASIY
jgi:hypothetical protein